MIILEILHVHAIKVPLIYIDMRKCLLEEVRECVFLLVFYDANCLCDCLTVLWETTTREGEFRYPNCGNEMSCLRYHWMTRQCTYPDPWSVRRLYIYWLCVLRQRRVLLILYFLGIFLYLCLWGSGSTKFAFKSSLNYPTL